MSLVYGKTASTAKVQPGDQYWITPSFTFRIEDNRRELDLYLRRNQPAANREKRNLIDQRLRLSAADRKSRICLVDVVVISVVVCLISLVAIGQYASAVHGSRRALPVASSVQPSGNAGTEANPTQSAGNASTSDGVAYRGYQPGFWSKPVAALSEPTALEIQQAKEVIAKGVVLQGSGENKQMVELYDSALANYPSVFELRMATLHAMMVTGQFSRAKRLAVYSLLVMPTEQQYIAIAHLLQTIPD